MFKRSCVALSIALAVAGVGCRRDEPAQPSGKPVESESPKSTTPAGSAGDTLKGAAGETADTVKGAAGAASDTVAGAAGSVSDTVKGPGEAAEADKSAAGEATAAAEAARSAAAEATAAAEAANAAAGAGAGEKKAAKPKAKKHKMSKSEAEAATAGAAVGAAASKPEDTTAGAAEGTAAEGTKVETTADTMKSSGGNSEVRCDAPGPRTHTFALTAPQGATCTEIAGATIVTAGAGFRLRVAQGAPEMSASKKLIEDDTHNRFTRYLTDEPDLVIFESASESGGSQYGFVSHSSLGGIAFSCWSDPMGTYNKDQVEAMARACQTLALREKNP